MDLQHIVIVILLILLMCAMYRLLYGYNEGYANSYDSSDGANREKYIQRFLEKEHRIFPFRYFTDDSGKPLPFVAVTGFFREKDAEDRYNEYIKNGIRIFGITAYKTFPNRALLDNSEGEYERKDSFDFPNKVRDWCCCFKNKENYGFTSWNWTVDISESDFYNAEMDAKSIDKIYDFIYICNKDGDGCPTNGWNAINRNFDLAKKCFPIMCNEFGMKGLIVGRDGCDLEKEYGSKLEVAEWLDWHVLQDKMRASKFLFVPNIFDASPRVVAECITKDLPVLMNRNILCGSKYINYETGELFTDDADIRDALTALLNKQDKISPKKWWNSNYSQEKSQVDLREFLDRSFPNELDGIKRVKFIL
jgi:hypothetical protein